MIVLLPFISLIMDLYARTRFDFVENVNKYNK
jgi:hypothetical protein